MSQKIEPYLRKKKGGKRKSQQVSGYTRNFIKPIPETHNVAVDESLLWLQVRVRKGSEYEESLRSLIESIKNQEKRP